MLDLSNVDSGSIPDNPTSTFGLPNERCKIDTQLALMNFNWRLYINLLSRTFFEGVNYLNIHICTKYHEITLETITLRSFCETLILKSSHENITPELKQHTKITGCRCDLWWWTHLNPIIILKENSSLFLNVKAATKTFFRPI